MGMLRIERIINSVGDFLFEFLFAYHKLLDYVYSSVIQTVFNFKTLFMVLQVIDYELYSN